MIEITQEQFQQAMPFVGAASKRIFERMQQSLENVYNDLLASIISPDLEAAAVTEGSAIEDSARQYTVLQAFIMRLRSHDLVMTDTGFGVVANDNISPASQARVDALKKELGLKRDAHLQNIVNRMRTVEGWAYTLQAEFCIRSLVWSPQLLSVCSPLGTMLTYEDLAQQRTAIDKAEMQLRKKFSDDLMESLLAEERKATYEDNHRQLIILMRAFIGSTLTPKNAEPADPYNVSMAYEMVANYIDNHIDSFAAYRNSTAYTANHTKGFENETTDPIFFFSC